jgi:hypothetical protein
MGKYEYKKIGVRLNRTFSSALPKFVFIETAFAYALQMIQKAAHPNETT